MATSINLSMFVVPNRIKYSDNVPEYILNSWNSKLTGFSCNGVELNNLDNETSVVEIWTHGDNSDNISDHGSVHFYNFPSIFPAWIFHGHKECETIILNYTDDEGEEYILNIELNQKDYRYRNFGTFEQVLESVI